ncbi:MAG: glycosyltransferase, partial [bacterium]
MKKYLFSIIVPIYNRSDEIVDLIRSFNAQTFSRVRFEVLLVDDGSTDNTAVVVDELIRSSSFQIRFYRRDHEGPGPARNYGMSQAEGEYFLFIDSDCIADPEWLTRLAEAIDTEKPDAFGGPDSVLDSFTPLQKAIDFAMTSFLTTGGMRGHSKKKLAKFYPRSFNMGIHHKIYETLGSMGSLRHGQDLEFSRRIVASGANVISVPEAVVYHKRRTSLRKFFRQIFNWGVARINLTLIDNAILEPLHFIPAIGTIGYLVILMLSPFHPYIFHLWLFGTAMAFGLLTIIFFSSLKRYKDIRAALLA